MKFGRAVVKNRVLILVVALLLLIPSWIGYTRTRINYDMLNYLPQDMDSVKGQNILKDEFGKGAFSLIIVEGMSDQEISRLKDEISQVNHVESVIWYDTIADISIPREMIPDDVYKAFNNGEDTMMAVFFDTATSEDGTMEAIHDIRSIANKNVYISGLSAMVTDLKDLCEAEEPTYVGLAVICALVEMMLLLDGWLVPLIFLADIGIAIILNMGTNIFLGEISYITKALSAVLQLAVTMDYSVFLWNSYNEQRSRYPNDNKTAMACAIQQTISSVIGSSITTIAGFIALCFMSFTIGRDLGLVMAKGVLLGVISCVTVLPSMILVFDKPLQKTRHKSLIPNLNGLADWIVKAYKPLLAVFLLLIAPAYMCYARTNDEVYYDMGALLPRNMAFVKANEKLEEDFDLATTHMVLVSTDTPDKNVRAMMKEMGDVKGVQYVLGLDSVLGQDVPKELIPDDLLQQVQSDNWQLLLINSEYHAASDAVNEQIDELTAILKKYDPSGMLIGEAPCMKDMIETTDVDFANVNAVSIIAVFLIILLVEKSFILPVLLIALIELAIFINLGIPSLTGTTLPFITPICISTIQLGATVDYAILMTTRYKQERMHGADKKQAVTTALQASMNSILVSGMGLFAATIGVAIYSNIDIITTMCMLLSRGAVVSMICVIFFLPALLMVFDKVIVKTTWDMKKEVRA